jgi:peptide chain release factor 3
VDPGPGTSAHRDTLAERKIEFTPRFAPQHFARVYPADPLRRKQLDTGLRALSEEGAAQVFYGEGESGAMPILGAVGMLQFDVMRFRLEHEYGAPCRLKPIAFAHPRWVRGPEAAIERAAQQAGRMRLFDTRGNALLLFENDFAAVGAGARKTSSRGVRREASGGMDLAGMGQANSPGPDPGCRPTLVAQGVAASQ